MIILKDFDYFSWTFIDYFFTYKKYLGDDWVPDYDGSKVACVVGNHTSFLDTPMNCLR